jgi:aspartate/methionine/tyrosine aminotransferase
VSEALGEQYPTSADLAEAIIDQANVALVPGESFGAPGYLRLSYAVGEEEIRRGVAAIADLMET